LNNFFQRQLLLILLGSALLILPACGSNNTIKTTKAPETVLNPESTPDTSMTEHHPITHSYTERIKKAAPKTYSALNAKTPQVATPSMTTQSTPNSTPSMETATPVKKSGGSSWIWWILLILALGGAGWYFWSKNQSEGGSSQPKPPVGGLSPVSGFTAVKDKIEDESQEGTSFWSKKLF